MRNLFLVVMFATLTVPTFAQANYVELRGSKFYQFADFTRTINDKVVIDFYYIRTAGQDQGFAGVGRTLKLDDSGSINILIYGVVGSHSQAGVMPAILIPSLKKGRIKTTAFLGWFIPVKGEVKQYLVLDTWDTTVEVTKKLDLGISVGFFLQDGNWNQQAGPMARLNLDKLGSWAVSQRWGPGGKELRFSRTFVF